MNIQEPLENILHACFENQYELAATFLRFQEYYESPEFRGKIFALEEYEQWYIANSPNGQKTGRFTYYEDWGAGGFNIPSEVLDPFYQGEFNPLSKREIKFLDAFNDRQKNGSFYIIGTSDEAKASQLKTSPLKHEIAHALFYTCQEYKTAVLALLDEIPEKEMTEIKDILANSMGYHQSVFDDETHAHLLTKSGYLQHGGVDVNKLTKVRENLESAFMQFSNGLFTS